MLSRIHQKLGTAGFVISIVALVAAMAGGAYAASGGLTGTQKKEVKKIAKQFAGAPGPAGAKGDTGAAGPAGAKGDAGAQGSPGTAGANGKSVTVTSIATGGSGCSGLGGALVKQEGAAAGTEVCNGEEGEEGEPGAIHPGETLPVNASETGVWSFGTIADAVNATRVPISFIIPLEGALDGPHVHYIKEGEAAPSGCTGGTAEVPKADPGNLCVYTTELLSTSENMIIFDPTPVNSPGASAYGAMLIFPAAGAQAYGLGTWAVTGG